MSDDREPLAGEPLYVPAPPAPPAAYPAAPYPVAPYPAAPYPATPYPAAYAGAQPSAPRHRGYPMAPAQSVRGLGLATQILLAVQAVVLIALLVPLFRGRDFIAQVRDDPTSINLSDAQDIDSTLSTLAVTELIFLIATAVVWIVWLHRCRTNVEAWGTRYQRLGAGWAIGAWFCPVVNLWFGYWILRDVLDDTERPPDQEWAVRGARPLLLAWELSWVGVLVMSVVGANSDTDTLDHLDTAVTVAIVSLLVRVAAAFLAVGACRQLTSAQTRRITATTLGG